MGKVHIWAMELHAQYFPKGYARPPSPEIVHTPRVDEVIVFEDLFSAGLRMLPHPVLVKIHIQLHQLMSNAIV